MSSPESRRDYRVIYLVVEAFGAVIPSGHLCQSRNLILFKLYHSTHINMFAQGNKQKTQGMTAYSGQGDDKTPLFSCFSLKNGYKQPKIAGIK